MIAIDLETRCLDRCEERIRNEQFVDTPFTPQNGAKKAETIAAQRAEWDARRDEREAAFYASAEERIADCAKSPLTARVLCASIVTDTTCDVLYAPKENDERAVVGTLWECLLAARRFATFNGTEFDVRILRARATRYNLPMQGKSTKEWTMRYRTYPHYDVFLVLNDWRPGRGTLADWCDYHGIAHDTQYTGADIYRLHKEGQHDAIQAKCSADTRATLRLAQLIEPRYL